MGHSENGILSITGFQARRYDRKFILDELSTRIENKSGNEERVFDFVQQGLRSATDIYKEGGHLQTTYKDRKYSLDYDNKRCIIDGQKEGLKESKPWGTIVPYQRIRTLTKVVNTPVFEKYVTKSQSKGYKSYIETGVRGFIKACLRESEKYGIEKGYFSNYASLIDFIHGCEEAREVKLTSSSISRLKSRNTLTRSVPRTKENELFISYVSSRITNFNRDLFFRELSQEKRKS